MKAPMAQTDPMMRPGSKRYQTKRTKEERGREKSREKERERSREKERERSREKEREVHGQSHLFREAAGRGFMANQEKVTMVMGTIRTMLIHTRPLAIILVTGSVRWFKLHDCC